MGKGWRGARRGKNVSAEDRTLRLAEK